jgi:hypothetical protein
MGFLDRVLGRKQLFSMHSSDLKMWQTSRATGIAPRCSCLDAQYDKKPFEELNFHPEIQDTKSEAWEMLEKGIETAVSNSATEFAPGLEMPPELWRQIVTLPPSISKLTSVRKLYLYGSHLVRVPPEIGEMANLEELDLYTSYCLHWLPYEVTRCLNLKRSRFSTRTLYGNYKYRPPFPQLGHGPAKFGTVTPNCSVCRKSCGPDSMLRVWISLRVATDVLPLLVNACSEDCIRRLPKPAYGYVDHPHKGGLHVSQPAQCFVPPRPGFDQSKFMGTEKPEPPEG